MRQPLGIDSPTAGVDMSGCLQTGAGTGLQNDASGRR
jgi:hypothetical protein